MHFYWSHLEATNAYPIHFTLLAAHCSSYHICILCSAWDRNCTPISEMAADLRHLLSGKAGGFKKKKKKCDCTAHYVWLLQSQHGVQSYVFIASARSVIPPPPCVCLQPTAATLIIWRLRWASRTPWWRPSAGCCCSPWARRAMLHRGHGMLKRVSSTELTS